MGSLVDRTGERNGISDRTSQPNHVKTDSPLTWVKRSHLIPRRRIDSMLFVESSKQSAQGNQGDLGIPRLGRIFKKSSRRLVPFERLHRSQAGKMLLNE